MTLLVISIASWTSRIVCVCVCVCAFLQVRDRMWLSLSALYTEPRV